MSDLWSVATSRKTVKVLSQTHSVAVQEIGIYTKPSAIFTVVEVPLAAFQAGHQATYLDPPASIIEDQISQGMVTSSTFVQSTDGSNLLAGWQQFTVSYTPPTGLGVPLTTQVLIPITALATRAAYTQYASTPPHEKPIVTAYNQLVALAGS